MPVLRVITGFRAGTTAALKTAPVVAGRDPGADLRLDIDRDLIVSARHCEFVPDGDSWTVRDLGSRNGTYVNGRLITATVRLRNGDIVMLGADGPQIVFATSDAAATATAATATASMPRPEDTLVRVRTAVRRATLRMRIITAVVVGGALLATAAMIVSDQRERTAWNEERDALEMRLDSLVERSRAVESTLQGEVTGLTSALRSSEDRLRRLQTQLASSRGDDTRADSLQQQLLSATNALRRQQLAASLDYSLIQRRNRRAVAMIWVEYTDGTRATGTAFAVRPDGTMLTNRHLVRGHDGSRRPRRIAVRFADSDQTFPATVLAVSPARDLAALRVNNVIGDVPVVGTLNIRSDTLHSGAPVALIGFPLGGEPARDGVTVARPVVSAGLVVSNTVDAIELQGLGAAGGSGSPILDAHGDVVAILYGGRSDDGVQVLLGVPAAAAAAFLSHVR